MKRRAVQDNDPLSLVRQVTTGGLAVSHTDQHYIFGGLAGQQQRLHESTETCFRRTHRGGGYYSLRDVFFFWEHAEDGVAQYRTSVSKTAGVTAVVVADAKDLKGYLTGQIDTCNQIDEEKRAEYLAEHSSAGHKHQQSSFSSTVQALARGPLPEELKEARDKVLQSFLELEDKGEAASSKTQGKSTGREVPALSREEMNYLKADRGLLTTFRADEFAASNRNSVLCKPGSDFSFVLKLINDHVLRSTAEPAKAQSKSDKKRSHDSSSKDSQPSKRSHSSSRSSVPPPGALGTPIFIVPDALTSVFSGYNAAQFLQDGIFVSSDECRQRGLKRNPDGHRFSHTCKNGKVIDFKVIDTAKKLSAEEWNRVVVVFVQGQTWQFKGWHYSNPVDVFDRALGIHVCLDDGSEVSKNILSWKCKILKIHKTRRHMDASAFNEFWILVEDYIRMHRPWLLK